MIDFHPITLADKALIESYTQKSNIRNCDLSFANMYCWQPTYKSSWAIVDGYLVIRFLIDGGEKLGYMQPIKLDGTLSFANIIPMMAQDAHRHGSRLRIIGVTEEGRESLKELYSGEFALHNDPCYEDYIYSRESLSKLSGKKLQPKRNHINQFIKRYGNYEYRALTPDIFADCLELDCKWRRANGDTCSDRTPERESMLRAFEHFEDLELRGGALYIDGVMVAFTYGSAINANTFCTHIEKAERDINGCYTTINRLFTSSLSEEFIYINREEDLGIEGLRRAKESYYPIHKQEKYTAIYLHHDERECKRLWLDVFGDDESFIDEFIIHHYSQHRMLRIADSDNRYISMLHIISFHGEIGKVAYIYGVATDSSHRGRGYATTLMHRAMEIVKSEGFDAAALIPSEEWLKGYYAKFGFQCGCPTTFRSYNNFDFGSGDPADDISMISPLTPRAKERLSELTSLNLQR